MIYPSSVELDLRESVKLMPYELPPWAEALEKTWTLSSGVGSFYDLTADMIRYTAPDKMPELYPTAVIHLFAGSELVGECNIRFKALEPEVEPVASEILPKEPEPEPEPEEEEIMEDHWCCDDPDEFLTPVKIEPTSIRTSPGQPVIIGIKKVYPGCDEACYQWRIAHGGGFLACDCGMQAIYMPPDLNKMCEANATVEMVCQGYLVQQCHITINTWGEAEPAYIKYDRDAHFTFEFWDPPMYRWQGRALPPGVTAPQFWIVDWKRTYDCADNEIKKEPYIMFKVVITWLPREDRWCFLTWAGHIPYEEYHSFTDIPLDPLFWMYKEDEDVRTKVMKESGCCPKGLIEILPDYMYL